MSLETYYKFTAPGRRPTHANNSFVWPEPGVWTTPIAHVVPCSSGYHLTTAPHLLSWLHAELWVAEGRGTVVDDGSKVVFGEARLTHRVEAWNERTAREFAAWCAEQALDNIKDDAIRAVCASTIEVSRRFAAGEASGADLLAAESAAWSAARSAARSAAESAARLAAESAAESAAWSAAWSAARSAAWSAQVEHLIDMLGLER